ncbi:hypothetical protein Patl1_32445 [Pistacia atlantica]|uniref:Uncharacterized protein n=1 Tax=Pistacia atlantica TaxID=434234 RepID=A0ACC1ANB2_9ROSI|nr:hypothetical protein Patl1_32445 [Pistacia atlantica]
MFDGIDSHYFHSESRGWHWMWDSRLFNYGSWEMAFTGNYNEYFGFAAGIDVVVYLMLVNDLIHGLFPEAVTIGEDLNQTDLHYFGAQLLASFTYASVSDCSKVFLVERVIRIREVSTRSLSPPTQFVLLQKKKTDYGFRGLLQLRTGGGFGKGEPQDWGRGS